MAKDTSASKVHYRKGYKYQLALDYAVQTNICPPTELVTEFIRLTASGLLYLKRGYAWDGCSGPTWDDKYNHRGGLIHDSIYQLIREGLLPFSYYGMADFELRRFCLEDGMSRARAWIYYHGLSLAEGAAATPGSKPYPVLTAP